MNTVAHTQDGALPDLVASGPLSELVLAAQRAPAGPFASPAADLAGDLSLGVERPLEDDDLQLALYLCYELHYRSFPTTAGTDPATVGDRLFQLEAEDDGPTLSRFLELEANPTSSANSSPTARSTS